MRFASEEEEEPISRGVDIDPPSADIPIAIGVLSEEEQLALALKDSMETKSDKTYGASSRLDLRPSSRYFTCFLFFVFDSILAHQVILS